MVNHTIKDFLKFSPSTTYDNMGWLLNLSFLKKSTAILYSSTFHFIHALLDFLSLEIHHSNVSATPSYS